MNYSRQHERGSRRETRISPTSTAHSKLSRLPKVPWLDSQTRGESDGSEGNHLHPELHREVPLELRPASDPVAQLPVAPGQLVRQGAQTRVRGDPFLTLVVEHPDRPAEEPRIEPQRQVATHDEPRPERRVQD